MSNQTSGSIRGISAPRMLVMGVGSSGVRAVSGMHRLNPELAAVVIDTDTKVLEATAMERVIHVGATITRGFSSGGDVELGRQSIEKDSSSIRNQRRVDQFGVSPIFRDPISASWGFSSGSGMALPSTP